MEISTVIILIAFLVFVFAIVKKSVVKDIESLSVNEDLEIVDARCINNILHFAHFLGCAITFTHEYNDKKSEEGEIFCVIEKDGKKIAVRQKEKYCTRFFNLQKENK